jgi:hypothetical protein
MLSCNFAEGFIFDSKFSLITEVTSLEENSAPISVCACGKCILPTLILPSVISNQEDFLCIFQYSNDISDDLIISSVVNFSYLGLIDDFRLNVACIMAINSVYFCKEDMMTMFRYIQHRNFELDVPMNLLLPLTSNLNLQFLIACNFGKELDSPKNLFAKDREIENSLNIPNNIMKHLNENIVIAGGAVAWLFSSEKTILFDDSDVDFYVFKNCPKNVYKQFFIDLQAFGYTLKLVNSAIVNCISPGFRKIQVIFTEHETVKEILDDFDLDTSKFAIFRDSEELFSVSTYNARNALITGICKLPLATEDIMHVRIARLIKAEKKGWKLCKNSREMVENCEEPVERKQVENLEILSVENLPLFVPLTARSAIFLSTSFYFPNRNNVYKNENIEPFLKSCVRGEIIKDPKFKGMDGIIPLCSPYSLKLQNVLPVFGCTLQVGEEIRKRVPCIGNLEGLKVFKDIENFILKRFGFEGSSLSDCIIVSVDTHTIQVRPETLFDNYVTLTPFNFVVTSQRMKQASVTWYASMVCMN